jgi:DNA-binding NarL/FixJ family response regulator
MKRVLLVDDHSVFRELLAVVLGWRTELKEPVQAGSSAEARMALNGLENRLDLAVVALDLPGRDGLDLIKELHGSMPKLPVLAVAKSPDPDLHEQALLAGAGEVITLQATEEEIVGAARRLGGA